MKSKSTSIIVFLFLSVPLFSKEAAIQIPESEELIDIFEEAKYKALRWKFNINETVWIEKDDVQYIEIINDIGKKNLKRYVHHTISLNAIEKDPQKGYLLKGHFRSQFRYDNKSNTPYREEEAYRSDFYLHPRGSMIMEPDVYMPNVRDIPLFPESVDPNEQKFAMQKGDQWEAPGAEIMQANILIPIPLMVKYEYLGAETINVDNHLKKIHKIRVSVQINHEVENSELKKSPRKLFGFSTSLIAWDEAEGMPYYMLDEYNLLMLFSNNVSQEFKIKSKTVYLKKPALLKEIDTLKDSLSKEFETYPIDKKPNVTVNNDGLLIELPDILFEYDSSSLTGESKNIVSKISKVLKKTGNSNLLIKGHTDNVGNTRYNKELSSRRAESVLKFLMDNGKIDPSRMSFEGMGDSSPLYDNTTDEGRKQNRRVEIIILKD